MLEMFRRDQFRQDLLLERCEELVALDERLLELDTLLAVAVSSRRPAPAARCACGAPIVWGSHFCANCGRPVAAAPAVISCAGCGAPMPAEAKFCTACGRAVAEPEPAPDDQEALPAAADPWET
jgi:hypothetical protein